MNLFDLVNTDSTEFAKKSGFYQDEAIRSPVLVKKNGRPKTVLISYEEFVRLRNRDQQPFTIDDMPDEIETAILEAKIPEELEDLNE